ncbi:MAG: cation:proton antiporter [Anaerococcus vaginalis]|uniref:cation:proton antiporter n=1 Tax=Anaerococcus vaginalis TaxID=33037 RepID=UPI00189A1622|nr:cation:proton antiporter [Anaerococcus vaginalis]MDU4378377.1 cation:proton antiporter [Anaerococcus vaginalis]MDU5823776.1 cation:proton antiporter [Anaerococcus vaginalis]MDU7649737.1 cation:proton antiporter [Anaerococcus vaginalis]
MLVSFGLIIIFGLIFGFFCKKSKIPALIGMLFTGIILGPNVLNLIDSKTLNISSELRQIALIVILIKAGLSLDISDLKRIGKSAILLSFLPASFEILAYFIFARIFFKIRSVDALLMGSVLAAVSPAVVVPRMVKLIEEKRGVEKSIPQMILAGASCDDIFVLVLFSSFLSMAKGEDVSLVSLVNVPISIILGIIVGAIIGYILYIVFEFFYKKGDMIRNSTKLIIILAISFLLVAMENILKDKIAFSSLLAVIAMSCVFKIKANYEVSLRLSEKFGKLWIFAEVLLFVLVGAEVNILYITKLGFTSIVMIFLALIIRSLGTLLSISTSNLNKKEKLFTVFSYMPKATVQAAIGAVPLANGLSSGEIILSMAVLGILITAPIGAIFIDNFNQKLLD